MTEPVTRDLVERPELREQVKASLAHWFSTLGECKLREGMDHAYGVALSLLDAMPSVECPRGWTRDEVLDELDTHPGAVCDYLHPYSNEWMWLTRSNIEAWHPEVRRCDVRVVLPEPATAWVPLTKLVGRTVAGCDKPVEGGPYNNASFGWQWFDGTGWLPFPDGALDIESGRVEVLAEGDA